MTLEPIEIDETFISGQEFIDSLSGFASWASNGFLINDVSKKSKQK